MIYLILIELSLLNNTYDLEEKKYTVKFVNYMFKRYTYFIMLDLSKVF